MDSWGRPESVAAGYPSTAALAGANGAFEGLPMARSDNLYDLPAGLPVPVDDGACDHLPGMPWPSVALPSTGGGLVALAEVETDWLVVYFYPRTGLPDQDPPGGLAAWDAIPGARGCTPQSCSYRDHHSELRRLGVRVFGISTQDTAYQREAASRLHLPFELLSDAGLEMARALRLPTFSMAGQTLIKRLTLIGRRRCIERCFYPVFPPSSDAENVLRYVRGIAAGAATA
jgi:peroxiredoxin